MTKEEQMLLKHLKDLAQTCLKRDICVFSDFLTLSEQSLFLSNLSGWPQAEVELTGGYEYAERKLICFSPVGAWCKIPAPLSLVRVKPVQQKFAEPLSHRDYLGAVLNLGIERCKIGDLLVEEGSCAIICTEQMATVIVNELTRIRHTTVTCNVEDLNDIQYEPKFLELTGTVSSLRLDAVIAMAFKGSRSKMSGFIEGEKVFVNGKCINSNSYSLKEGDIISVRGMGKFVYDHTVTKTKKDRLLISVKIFN